jgi:gliding motility-associated-like protein
MDVRFFPLVNLGNDTAVSWRTLMLDAGNEGSTYRWSTGETTQTIDVEAGNYEVWVEVNLLECITYDTINIMYHPDPGGCSIGIPTAFTPNRDGRNDLLHVRGYCIKDMELLIYNRWGEQVYRTIDMNDGWDGIYKGKLQEADVYVYILQGHFIDDTRFFKKGNVTMLH